MRTTINRVGKYDLRAVLARTPLSTVYDAWDSDIARRVAVKLMPLSALDDSEAGEAFARFKRGAQAAGQLNHPNIVAVYDYGETEDYAYLVMEFVNGPTLKTLFDENQRFALADICRIIGSILEALQYSHDRGVVHRDVKPANIMFTKENQVKITDFGIARLEDSELTQAGMVIGTPAYMSPEQFLGEKIDLRTDVYSTGVVLYHVLTGERPYEGNLATIMHKVLYGEPLRPSRVSTLVTPALDAVVTRAMARNREDRFQSAAEFNAALQAARKPAAIPLGRPHEVDAPLTGLSPPGRRDAGGSSSGKLGVLALAAVLLVAGGAAAWYGLLAPAAPPTTDTVAQRAKDEQIRAQQDQQAKLQQEQQARRQQEEQARVQQEQARLQQEQQARLQQEQQVRLQQEQQARLQQEQQVRLQQEQQARLQQEQQARLQQEQQARRQQEQQARLQQEQQERLQREQEARQKLAQDQARQRQDQEARQKGAAQEQGRQKQEQDLARQKPSPAPGHLKPPPEQAHANAEPETPPPPVYAVTSSNGATGLVCESITSETASRFGLDSPQGMVVTGVLTGGAAYKAGIRDRDVILKIKGSEAHDLSALSRIAADNPAGQAVPVEILSHGSRKTVQLMLN